MVIIKKRDIEMSRFEESSKDKYSELENRINEQSKRIDSLIDWITALQFKIEDLKLNKCSSGCGNKKEVPPCPSWPPPPGYIPEWPPVPRDPATYPDRFLELNSQETVTFSTQPKLLSIMSEWYTQTKHVPDIQFEVHFLNKETPNNENK